MSQLVFCFRYDRSSLLQRCSKCIPKSPSESADVSSKDCSTAPSIFKVSSDIWCGVGTHLSSHILEVSFGLSVHPAPRQAAQPAASPGHPRGSRCGLGRGGLVRTCPGGVAWCGWPCLARARARGPRLGSRSQPTRGGGHLLLLSNALEAADNGRSTPGGHEAARCWRSGVEPRG